MGNSGIVYDAGTIWNESSGCLIQNFEYLPKDSSSNCPDAVIEDLFDISPKHEPEPQNVAVSSPPVSSSEEIDREWEKRFAEESRRALDAGRQQGLETEREAHANALRSLEEKRHLQAEKLLEGFAQARDRYFENVEHEVVHLALAVAARILRRESQMDPLLLTGAVRVALGQLSGSTTARLRVPAEDCELWQQAIGHLPNLQLRPEVLADPALHLGDCILETGLGSVDLGLRSQLAEIERGFFDRAPGIRTSDTRPVTPADAALETAS